MGKNYGIFDYKKKNPVMQDYRAYIADMFNLRTTDRAQKILDKITANKKVDWLNGGVATQYCVEGDIPKQIISKANSIFIDKQMQKHNRETLLPTQELDKYGTTLSDIVQTIFSEYESKLSDNFNRARDLSKKLSQAIKQDNGNKSPQTQTMREELNKLYNDLYNTSCNFRDGARPAIYDNRGIQETFDNQQFVKKTKIRISDTQLENTELIQYDNVEHKSQEVKDYNEDYDYNKTEPVLKVKDNNKTDKQGKHKDIELNKTLKKILDSILGDMEMRSTERGYSRPHRASHFIKNCFLPVYKSNKHRKRPAFFIDASGSMMQRRGDFNCITSAIAGFLRNNHRIISELHPRYYQFTGREYAYSFDIIRQTPFAHGGTSIRFVKNIDPKDLSVVITDGNFEHYEFAMLRKWALYNKNAVVHWVVNQKTTYRDLQNCLKGCKNQTVHYTGF